MANHKLTEEHNVRKLTITRTKSFVACLMSIKVYIEDHSSSELTINDVPCRKLGEISNGETKTFEIGEEAAKVFVIGDKLSKSYCNEFYQLPEGQEDISLSGKNCFNPATGNAFRFDNNNNEAVLANRKRSTRKGAIIMTVAIIVGAAAGFLLTWFLLR